MTDHKFKNYIYDLGVFLTEKAKDAKYEKDHSLPIDLDYKIGYLMALYEVISLMKEQAQVFNIDQKDIGLENINPDLEFF